MASILVELRVEMEDGTTHDVVADQRDIAKWEIQDFGTPFADISSRMHLGLRWLAWSALSRRGVVDLDWPAFDAQCVEASDPPGDGEVAVTDADPGTPAPSGRASSRSRGARGNR